MSRADAAGCDRSSCQSVSVVPMIQWPPHGMTNSTEVAVRRISPASPVIAERGTTRCTPLEARTRRPGRTPTSLSIRDMSSLHTPVAATTVRARTSNSGVSGRLQVADPDADHLAGLPDEPGDPGAGHHGRAEAGRGPGQVDHQPGVVDLPVVVADRAGDRVGAQAGEQPPGAVPGQVPVQRHAAAAARRSRRTRRTRPPRPVVGPVPGPGGRRRRSRQRHQDRHRPDQVRREPAGRAGRARSAPRAPGAARAAPGSAGRRGSACWTGWTCRRPGRGPRPGRRSARGRRRRGPHRRR